MTWSSTPTKLPGAQAAARTPYIVDPRGGGALKLQKKVSKQNFAHLFPQSGPQTRDRESIYNLAIIKNSRARQRSLREVSEKTRL